MGVFILAIGYCRVVVVTNRSADAGRKIYVKRVLIKITYLLQFNFLTHTTHAVTDR